MNNQHCYHCTEAQKKIFPEQLVLSQHANLSMEFFKTFWSAIKNIVIDSDDYDYQGP